MKQSANNQALARTCGPQSGVRLLTTLNLEELIGADHLIRGISRVVRELDWGGYLSRVRSRGSVAGRPALHPRVLATLWLYGMSQGVSSARELARRCRTDLACLWALGGQQTNHHTLSDFLRQEQGILEDLLSQSVWALRRSGVASFDTLLVDGTKVDARASADSFHSEAGLRRKLGEQLSRLRQGGGGEPARQRSARQRAEREAVGRFAAAAEMLRQRQAAKRARGPSYHAKAAAEKASATDAEARFMRRSDGGVRASVNVQVGCCGQSGAVLYVGATDQGNDAGLAASAVRGMERICGHRASRVLADGDYGGVRSAAAARDLGVLFLVPPKRAAVSPSRRGGLREARASEDWWRTLWAEHEDWARRKRMGVERVIGSMKRRGLRRIPVFGLAGARGWALWHALTHNVLLGLGIRG